MSMGISTTVPAPPNSIEDLIAAAGYAMSHDLLLALVVDTAKARRRIREAGGGLTGVEQVLRLEVEAITTALATPHGRVGEVPAGWLI